MNRTAGATGNAADIHKRIQREAQTLARLSPGSGYGTRFPALAELVKAAEAKVRYSRRPDGVRMVMFHGKRYGIEQTIFSRVCVFDRDTGARLVCGSPFAT